jgi:hypothetical protein
VNKSFLTLTRIVAMIGLVCGLGQYASATVITFDSNTGLMANGGSFTEGDFTITSVSTPDPGNYVDIGSSGFTDGNHNDFYGTMAAITLTAGGLFDVTSVDIANLSNSGGGATSCGTGFRIEIDTVTGANPYVCQATYAPTSSTYATETLNITGVNELDVLIVSNTFAEQYVLGNFEADNVVVSEESATPEPTTLLLGFGGLALIGIGRRFRRASPRQV